LLFDQNDGFTVVDAGGGTAIVNSTGGGGNVDLSNVSQDIIPLFSEVYDIGSNTKRWFNGYFTNEISLGSVTLTNTDDTLVTASDVVVGSLLADEILITTNMIIPSDATKQPYLGTAGIVIVDGSLDVQGDWILVPRGTTAQRPITGENGMLRYNTTTGGFEGYVNGAWGAIGGGGTPVTLTYSTGTASGDGTTTQFAINAGRTVDDILVFVNGICFTPTIDYTISGTVLTFTDAPANAAEITFRYLPI
jgi:hypothetical protein